VLALYKYHEAAERIINNSGSKEFYKNIYPKTISIKDLNITLYFGVNMFQHCKQKINYSIFCNTKNIRAPYIPNYYILCYSTICESPTLSYSYEQVIDVAEVLNHGALEESEHFCL